MAVSGSSNFTATRNQIIRQAALDVKAISAGATMSAEMMSDFAFRMNAMVKDWNASGIHVWTLEEATLFPQPGQVAYTLGPGSTDHCTMTYVKTALAATYAAGATVLSVDLDDGILDGDHIGVVLDSGSIHWSTVSGAPAGNVVTITDGLASAASDDRYVYTYTSDIDSPLDIAAARRYEVRAARDTEINFIERLDYRSLPNKTQRGMVNQWFYDNRRDSGILSLYYAPQTVDYLINFTWQRAIQDFDAAGDNPDLPQEWISTLISGLANEMKHQFPVTIQRGREIERAFLQKLDNMRGFDREGNSIFIQPDV